MMNDYNQMCDIFSIGVMLFVMLTTKQPFKRSVKKNKNNANYIYDDDYLMLINNNDKYWDNHDNVNKIAKDLLIQMMCDDKSKRIKIPDILSHEWTNDKYLKTDDELLEYVERFLDNDDDEKVCN